MPVTPTSPRDACDRTASVEQCQAHDTDAPLCRDQIDSSCAMPAGGWWRELEPRLNNRSPAGKSQLPGLFRASDSNGSHPSRPLGGIRPCRSSGSRR